MKLIVVNHVSLDGVMQSPGRPDEDTRDGFEHGGWATGRAEDEALAAAIGERMAGAELLLGRRSYEDMLASWNERGGPFKEALNAMRKHVVSHDPEAELPWPNSTLLGGDAAAAVEKLKGEGEGNLVAMGSGELIRTALLPAGLVDELLLMIHPLVLGRGRRLFNEDGDLAALELLSAEPVATGVIAAAYRPAR
jgi:dihydrofolate reductase